MQRTGANAHGRWGRRITPLVAIVAALTAGAGTCDTPDGSLLGPLATINYEQLGSCVGYRQSASDVQLTGGLGPHTAFVVFGIATVDNTSTGARDFDLDPSRFYINADRRLYADPTLTPWVQDPFGAEPGVMRAGLVTVVNGKVYVVVDTDAADGLAEASATSYTLMHDTAQGSEGVLMVKKNRTQTSWPQTRACEQVQSSI